MKGFMNKYSRGYLLPAAILLGLAVATISGTFLIYSVSSSESLNSQNYNSIAEEAARSGIEYADSCLSQSTAAWSGDLRPQTGCDGTGDSGSHYVTRHKHSATGATTEWQSRFVVSRDTTTNIVTSTGYVELLNAAGAKVGGFSKKLSMSMGEAYDTYPTSTGQSLTDIKNDLTDCAIANGSLYCWGSNGNGQVGDSTTNDRTTPTRVGGALAGKTVTRVSVSNSSVCAIGDGRPYCWGADGSEQLGKAGGSDVRTPIEDVPRTSTGPLKLPVSPLDGQYVTDIGTASSNNPAALIWPFASAFQHSCALTANGAVSCWGYGGFRQNTGGGSVDICILICIPTGRYSYPSHTYPTLVKGYSDSSGPFDGKKAVRVGVSSHDSCLVAQGILYCWGVKAPLAPEGFGNNGISFLDILTNFEGFARMSCTLPLGLFSDAHLTLIPFNPCVSQYSNGYDAINSNSSQAGGTLIDPNAFDISSNKGCWMGNRNFYCFGVSPAFNTFWTHAFRAPYEVRGSTDVTDMDNGDYNDMLLGGGLTGLYCFVERGVGKCAGNPLNGNVGTGSNGWSNFQPLLTLRTPDGLNNDPNGLGGQVATKIAAGVDHGCVIANGRLYCWGGVGPFGALYNAGRLANGGFYNDSYTPRHSGTGGSTPVGTGLGQLAAHNSVSSGEKHTCGIANGKVFCWGDGTDGKLGMGNDRSVDQPRAVPVLVNRASTKVSAGKTHTCAISEGQLYCWGANGSGQLGINSMTGSNNPVLVNGYGALTLNMRVTDVSVSDNNTCAVANGKVYCWGANGSRQVGDNANTTTNRLVPNRVNGGSDILGDKAATAVSIGQSHACAVANSDLFCWGNNANGRAGKGNSSNTDPAQVTTGAANNPRGPNNMLPSVSGVSAGSDFTCALFNSRVGCWGNNANGRTGQGPTNTTGNTLNPTLIGGTDGGYFATSISAGREHVCALMHGNESKTNGNLYCWGKGAAGQLGYGDNLDKASAMDAITGGDMRETPTDPTSELRSVTSVSAGAETSCAIANAVIVCWGNGSSGQFGTGPAIIASSTTPIKTTSYQIRSSAYAKGPVF